MKTIRFENEKLNKLEIPVEIVPTSVENIKWVFDVYLIALEALEAIDEMDYENLENLYIWLKMNVLSYLPEIHQFEVIFGIGALAQQDGMIDYFPEE